jgi:hypothetical protein
LTPKTKKPSEPPINTEIIFYFQKFVVCQL